MISSFAHVMFLLAGMGILLGLLTILCAIASGVFWYLYMLYSHYDSQEKRSSEETRRRTSAK